MSKKFLDYNGLATLVNKLKDLFPLKSETASKNFVNNITGNLEDLDTETKANLVAAINEAATSGGGEIRIEDFTGETYNIETQPTGIYALSSSTKHWSYPGKGSFNVSGSLRGYIVIEVNKDSSNRFAIFINTSNLGVTKSIAIWGYINGVYRSNEARMVTEGEQFFNGVKTFGSRPVINTNVSAPTSDNQLVDKKYVDDSLTNYYTKDEVDLYTIPILAVNGNMILGDGYGASWNDTDTLASASKAINVLTAKCAGGAVTTGAILFKMLTQDSFIANAESFFTTQQTSYKFRGGYDKGSGELHVGWYITVTGSWTDNVFSASEVNVRKGYSYKLGDMVNKIDQSVYTFNNVSASWSMNNTATNQSMTTEQKNYLQSRFDRGTLQNLSILAANTYGACLLTYVASWNGSGITSYVFKGVYENNMQAGSSTTYNLAIMSIQKSDSTGQLTGKYSFETRVDVLARKSDVYAKDQVYTKAEVDALIQAIANYDSTTGTLNILPVEEEESEGE